jgi:2-amino-4-hydroxy-6-hydroxymethyldihydropteridine diphosphokinase
MARTGIALGSNLGDRAANMRAAVEALGGISAAPMRVAPLYETEPQGCPDGSPAFLNTVVEIDWPGDPLDLLEKTRAIEERLGRAPNPLRNAPRVIDVDILYCGDAVVDSAALTLPHPRMAMRSFVLMPLADLDPDFSPVPGGPTVRECLAALPAEASPPRLVAGS